MIPLLEAVERGLVRAAQVSARVGSGLMRWADRLERRGEVRDVWVRRVRKGRRPVWVVMCPEHGQVGRSRWARRARKLAVRHELFQGPCR